MHAKINNDDGRSGQEVTQYGTINNRKSLDVIQRIENHHNYHLYIKNVIFKDVIFNVWRILYLIHIIPFFYILCIINYQKCILSAIYINNEQIKRRACYINKYIKMCFQVYFWEKNRPIKNCIKIYENSYEYHNIKILL